MTRALLGLLEGGWIPNVSGSLSSIRALPSADNPDFVPTDDPLLVVLLYWTRGKHLQHTPSLDTPLTARHVLIIASYANRFLLDVVFSYYNHRKLHRGWCSGAA